jgi:hypothetical protein
MQEFGGAEGIRTLDLLDAIEARSQLRHGPTGAMSTLIASNSRTVKRGFVQPIPCNQQNGKRLTQDLAWYSYATIPFSQFCYPWNIVGNSVSKGYSRHPLENGG